jgi:hypothetical protein
MTADSDQTSAYHEASHCFALRYFGGPMAVEHAEMHAVRIGPGLMDSYAIRIVAAAGVAGERLVNSRECRLSREDLDLFYDGGGGDFSSAVDVAYDLLTAHRAVVDDIASWLLRHGEIDYFFLQHGLGPGKAEGVAGGIRWRDTPPQRVGPID